MADSILKIKVRFKMSYVKREWVNPLFAHFQKHYCPLCNERLTAEKAEKIVDSISSEANQYNLSDGEKIKVISTVFRCKKCNKAYSVKETKENDFLISRWK